MNHANSPCHGRRTRSVDVLMATLTALVSLAGCAVAPVAAPVTAPVMAAPAAPPAPNAQVAASPAPDPATLVAERAPSDAEPARAVGSRSRLDPAEDAERADLWQRIRDGYAMPDLDNDLVRRWEQFYARQPDYMRRMTDRGARYLFHIVEEIQRRELPLDLALLPFIESAFNPQAMSHARASGMWQFMPDTGKDFELRQNLFRDDRRDVLASTRAALDYLTRLHRRFGDWHLALAAYNWGQGNVQRAIDANARAGRPTDYSSLRMPDETRNYVPKLQAIKNIVARPADFAITLSPLHNHPYFTTVAIDQDIDVALVARLAGLTLEEFHQLNPQLNKPVILAAGTPQVLLPYDNANEFVQALAQHTGPRASWTAWVAPRTLKPAEAARLVNMPVDLLRDVNRIPDRMLVRVGSTLLVQRHAKQTDDVSEHLADTARLALAPEARPQRQRVVRAAKGGESVAALARRVGMAPEQLARLNGVQPSARFAGGHSVKVLVPTGAKAAPPRTAARQPARQRSAQAKARPAASARQAAAPRGGKAAAPAPRAARSDR